jgi:hypothetical protein
MGSCSKSNRIQREIERMHPMAILMTLSFIKENHDGQ